MDHLQTGRLWNKNAEAWTAMARAGYDSYRDCLNTPAFMAMLPEVSKLTGLDIGCGEGHNTRLLARAGARMIGLDIAPQFLKHARQTELADPCGIQYTQGSGLALPFPNRSFDFVTAFMSLMDMPDIARVLAEAHRVLRPGGFLQFSILHPCTNVPVRHKVKDAQGQDVALTLAGYFQPLTGEIEEWSFSSAPPAIRQQWPLFKVPRYTHTLSQWLNKLIETGFAIERLSEPVPPVSGLQPPCTDIEDAQLMPYFLHLRVRKS
jgi:SAM-dependent methyltransferase